MNSYYTEVLIDHNLHPLHRGKIADADLTATLTNSSCGDKLKIHLKIKNRKIVDGSFEGQGCAVSQASADLMLDLLIGKTIKKATELAPLFQAMVHGEEKDFSKLEDAQALQNVAKMPARTKCALLAWKVCKKLENY